MHSHNYAELRRDFLLLQGNPDPHRRNYTGLLEDIASTPDITQEARFELDLYTWGSLDPALVPPSVVDKIVYKRLRFKVGPTLMIC